MKLVVFGLNHRTAPLEVREAWALSAEESSTALSHMHGKVMPSEHVILSTCNRIEFYSHIPAGFSPGGEDPGQQGAILNLAGYADFYRQIYPDSPRHRLARCGSFHAGHFYVHTQDAAVQHLFRLASGLDSMIVGESQILRQIKDAFAAAKQAQTAGRFFHQLFPAALRTGKKVRSETAISDGCITPGQAALKLAREAIGDLAGRSLLVVGSGKIASSAAAAFRDERLGDYLVINRTEERAREVVRELGVGLSLPWNRLQEALGRADLIVSSTGAVDPIVSRALLARIQDARGHRPLVVIDLAIPRDFEAGAGEIPGVSLFNIDDLNRVIQENVAQRIEHIPRVEEILREEMRVFERRRTYAQVDPVLRHMIERFEQIRLGELQAFISQFPPEYHPFVKELTSSLVKKLLHFPIAKLKSLRDLRGLNDAEVSFLKHLFLPDL